MTECAKRLMRIARGLIAASDIDPEEIERMRAYWNKFTKGRGRLFLENDNFFCLIICELDQKNIKHNGGVLVAFSTGMDPIKEQSNVEDMTVNSLDELKRAIEKIKKLACEKIRNQYKPIGFKLMHDLKQSSERTEKLRKESSDMLRDVRDIQKMIQGL